MQCPQCHAQSVYIKEGEKRCEAKGCTFVDFHVITYENEIRQFQGEKGPQNRYTSLAQNQRETKAEKNFAAASKDLRQLANLMELPHDIIEKAETKLLQILMIKYSQKQKHKENGSQKPSEKRIKFSDEILAGYSLYLACFQRKLYFKDVRIVNELGFKKSYWETVVRELSGQLKNYMDIPVIRLQHDVLRVAHKRKINKIQINAMMQMARKMRESQNINDAKNVTIAAFIFWQIMKRSSTYNNEKQKFDIRNYLKKKSSDNEEQWWTQRHFETSIQTVRLFKTEKVGVKLLEYIPDFETRIPQEKIRND